MTTRIPTKRRIHPEACWILSNPHDELARVGRLANEVHIRRLIAATPVAESFIGDHSTRIAARLGLSNYQAEKISFEALILNNFPTLTQLFLTGFYLPATVSRILELLMRVPDDLAPVIDLDVTDVLGPTVPNQYPLTPGQATKKLLPILREVSPESIPPTDRTPQLQVKRSETCTTFTLTVPLLDGQAIEQLIAKTAKKYQVTNAEAMILLITGQAEVQVTLNLFKDAADPAESLFAAGGLLEGIVAKEWLDRVTHMRMIGPSATNSYSPNDAQRAYLEARDVHCRFPGCTAPAHKCDVDHIHRFEDGGPTHTDNLHLLCRHHHRLKTAGVWDVTRYPDSSEIWSSADDGHTITTEAEGPLARTTFEQKLSRLRTIKDAATSSQTNPPESTGLIPPPLQEQEAYEEELLDDYQGSDEWQQAWQTYIHFTEIAKPRTPREHAEFSHALRIIRAVPDPLAA